MPRTVVIHIGGIGDLLLTFPTLSQLRTQGRLTLVGQPERIELAMWFGVVDEAVPMDWIQFDSLFSDPSPVLVRFLKQFDRAIVCMKDDGLIARRMRECGVGDVHVFSGIPPEDWTLHATEYFLNRLNLNGSQQDFEPPIADDDIHDVVIHPGSGGKGKNWPIERFHELAATLVESGHAIEWICGPAEDFLAVPEGAQVWQGLSLVQIAQRLSSTRQYIGNDSGITHLAALCGCKTVAVFGPTNPDVWAPRGQNVRIVRTAQWPTVEAVIDAINGFR